MAPTEVTDRASKSKSHGLTITSAVSPGDFAVAVYNLATKERTILDESVFTRDHGKNHTGTWTVDITYLEDRPGKYLLLFMLIDFEDYAEVIAKGKPFYVRKSDF
ncbi:hypothetical protein M407DRAFT_17709 [Tulasnella calospora MUT 4182]|uniref:Uncharacterized protein n=1 Tax=Tulasnella calospora MUT 4182 TaxID=1051891 RepID=A0A0C3QWW7_9AGAM|nr:hypothetical protein M407DRAFT_17709 [Tulasnella calospora MUT 4182]